MSWVQPESDGRFACGSDVGLRLYSVEAERDGGGEVSFEMVDFRPMRQPVTCLASYRRALEKSCVMGVGTQSGELSLQFYPAAGSEALEHPSGSTASAVPVYEASGRACRQIAFNHANSNLLACGFDHHDSYPSLTVCDFVHGTDVAQPLGPQTTLWSMQSEHADAMLDMPRPPPQVASTSAGSTPRFGEYGPAPGGSGVTSLSW
ncbi:hypothetical protein IWQ57_003480, partial [Coemansia nantahalensis]